MCQIQTQIFWSHLRRSFLGVLDTSQSLKYCPKTKEWSTSITKWQKSMTEHQDVRLSAFGTLKKATIFGVSKPKLILTQWSESGYNYKKKSLFVMDLNFQPNWFQVHLFWRIRCLSVKLNLNSVSLSIQISTYLTQTKISNLQRLFQ